MKFVIDKGTFFKPGGPRWAFVLIGERPVAREGEECRATLRVPSGQAGATFESRRGMIHG